MEDGVPDDLYLLAAVGELLLQFGFPCADVLKGCVWWLLFHVLLGLFEQYAGEEGHERFLDPCLALGEDDKEQE